MTSTEYIEKMIQLNEIFYVDTSAVMAAEWFRSFVIKAEPLFKAAGKHIIVPPAVRSELIRHYSSSDQEKQARAQEAVEILAEHKELFQAPGGKLDNEEISKAFADSELLALLLVNRRGHRQLLIANDRGLSSDAYSLNLHQSCQGSRISVCHLNHFGELQVCDCVKKAQLEKTLGELVTENHGSEEKKPQPVPDEEEINKEALYNDEATLIEPEASSEGVKRPVSTKKTGSAWRWVLTYCGGAVSGYFVGKYRKSLAYIFGRAITLV